MTKQWIKTHKSYTLCVFSVKTQPQWFISMASAEGDGSWLRWAGCLQMHGLLLCRGCAIETQEIIPQNTSIMQKWQMERHYTTSLLLGWESNILIIHAANKPIAWLIQTPFLICGETLQQPFSTWREPIGKMGKIFSAGPVVIGQGAMALN